MGRLGLDAVFVQHVVLVVRLAALLPVACEEGSYLRLIDSCISQLKAQGPSRTCNESKEEEEEVKVGGRMRCPRRTPCSALDRTLKVWGSI